MKNVKLLRSGIAELIKQPGMKRNLKDEQQMEAFRALVSDKFSDEQIAHSYFKLPTGFGKTVMFARMVRAYYNELKPGQKRPKIIVIVPRLSLMDQTIEQIKIFGDITATEYSGRKKDKDNDIIITTYHSLNKVYDMIGAENIGFMVADEAHHILGEKISRDFESYSEFVPIIGFTATPEYEENRAIANILNTEIFAMDIPTAVKKGVLCPVKGGLCRLSIVCDLSKVSVKKNGEYDYDEIASRVNLDSLTTEIARAYINGFDEETGVKFNTLRAIINCPNSKIANLQAAKINKLMGRKVAISLHKVGISDKEYEKLKEDFQKNGKYSVACQVGTLTEGFDDKTVSLCINYPTHSRVKAEQTAGRVIRTDESNPKKIAFVLDTVFRTSADETPKDILRNAAAAHQVLFNDITDGLMVLFPKDFRRGLARVNKSDSKKKRKKDEEPDFELITDTDTLMDLKRLETERIKKGKGQGNLRTKEWLTAGNLAKDPDFPCDDARLINQKLKDWQPIMKNYIRIMVLSNVDGKKFSTFCLHRDAVEEFALNAGFDLTKTDEWLSATDLAKDPDFPIRSSGTISKKLQELQPKMSGFIQTRLSESQKIRKKSEVLCVRRDKKEEFAREAGFYIKKESTKTEEWLSAADLAKDPDFPHYPAAISKKMMLLQPEMPDAIQTKTTKSYQSVLCVRRDARKKFLHNAMDTFLPQNAGWQSAEDLIFDPTFPVKSLSRINNNLLKLRNEMPDFIQTQKFKIGGYDFCLHRDGREEFLQKIGYYEQFTIPEKTEEWMSASELANDPDFPRNDSGIISKKLQELQPKMSEFIQTRLSESPITHQKSKVLCLRRDKKEEFAKEAHFDRYKELFKTDEWLSVADLIRGNFFKTNSSVAISQKMKLLQPEMSDVIQKRIPQKMRAILCLRRDGVEKFYQKAINTFLPLKEGWLSTSDLAFNPDFPINDVSVIEKKLRKFRTEIPDLIKMQELKIGVLDLCLHQDGLEKLLELLRREKTKSLQKATDVLSNETRRVRTVRAIKSVMDEDVYKK